MYRQNADFFISDGTPKIVAKLIRHERYEQRKYHYMTVPYSDNILVADEPVDYPVDSFTACNGTNENPISVKV
jgi:hypothetical protein